MWFAVLLVVAVALCFVLFAVHNVIARRSLGDLSPRDASINKALRTIFLVAIVVSTMSFILVIARSLDGYATQDIMRTILDVDTMAIKNLMHGGLLFGTVSLFRRERNARYFVLEHFGLSLMTISSAGFLLRSVVLATRDPTSDAIGHVMVGLVFTGILAASLVAMRNLNLLVPFSRRPSYGVISTPMIGDVLARLTRLWKAALRVEAGWHGVWVLAAVVLELSAQTTDGGHHGHGDTVYGVLHAFVGSYTLSLHRAFVTGTGYAAATKLDRRLTLVYLFGTLTMAGYQLVVAIVGGVTSPADWRLALSIFVVVGQVTVSCYSAYVGFRFDAEVQRHLLAANDGAPRPSAQSRAPILRPSLRTQSFNPFLHSSSRRAALRAALWSLVIFALWESEPALMVFASSPSLRASSQPADAFRALASASLVMGDAMSYGLHGVAMFIFAYYRSMQNASVFAARRGYHFLTHLAFAGVAALQVVHLIGYMASAAADATRGATAGLVVLLFYFAVRAAAYVAAGDAFRKLRMNTAGFGGGAEALEQTAVVSPSDDDDDGNEGDGEDDEDLAASHDEQGDDAHELLPARAHSPRRHRGDRHASNATATCADAVKRAMAVPPRPGEDIRAAHEALSSWWTALRAHVGWFEMGSIAFSLLLVLAEFLGSMPLTLEDFVRMGGHTVSYEVAFHFIFIVGGYGLRATWHGAYTPAAACATGPPPDESRNILFLDVYRLASAAAAVPIVAQLMVLFAHPTTLGAAGAWAMTICAATLWLAGCTVGSFVTATRVNRVAQWTDYSVTGTHM